MALLVEFGLVQQVRCTVGPVSGRTQQGRLEVMASLLAANFRRYGLVLAFALRAVLSSEPGETSLIIANQPSNVNDAASRAQRNVLRNSHNCARKVVIA